ncbi:AAA domain-containing protein [Phytomonospora sp. NPDC050363]|uniref:AAA domain-containing protein n=1 Tax=Phytomonospora sp. NPDC050363 TaxID=3155642 RepID=UPI0033BFFFC6
MPVPNLVDRAVRLFRFLARVQQLRSDPPRTVEAYQQGGGAVLWFAGIPEHPAVTAIGPEPEPDDVLLTVDRVARVDPPRPTSGLAARLIGVLDDPELPPQVEHGPDPEHAAYLETWNEWAATERVEAPVRDLYGRLFAMHVAASGHPEDLELVLGIGCLAWTPPEEPPVRRHLLTAPIAIGFDADTGRLSVVRVKALDALAVELEMIDPGRIAASAQLPGIRSDAQGTVAHPMHRGEQGPLVRRLVHTLDADGGYSDADVAPEHGRRAQASFAPALILRRRSHRDLVEIYEAIGEELTHTRRVPEGLRPLVDPDHIPETEPGGRDGALVTVDGDPFLPLPANDTQRRILEQVDTRAQTLVQGPPGTGKTHTAALLISHLLARGERVLVTAHTDRALKEVRDKLPSAIKPLSVAVVGTSREDMSDLKVAVERIAVASAEHDPRVAAETIDACLAAIDRLGHERAGLHARLVDAREDEVRVHDFRGNRGTLAQIATRHRELAPRFSWLNGYAEVDAADVAPLDSAEALAWLAMLRDESLAADEPEADARLVELATVPDRGIYADLLASVPGLGVLADRVAAAPVPRVFADLVATERTAVEAETAHKELREHPAYRAVTALDPELRGELRERLHRLADEAGDLARWRERWMDEALVDVRSGRAQIWRARARQISELIDRASPLVERIGPLTHVEVKAGEFGALTALARQLQAHLVAGGRIKAGPDGVVRPGTFTPKPVKQAQPLFERVRVDGLPPTTRERVDVFCTYADALAALAALDRAWPDGTPVPAGKSLSERLQWHLTERAQLGRVLALGGALDREEQSLSGLGLPRPDWTDLASVRSYAALVEAAAAADTVRSTGVPLARIAEVIGEVARWKDAAPCVRELDEAVSARDVDAYAAAHARLARLHEVRAQAARRDELARRLSTVAEGLREAVQAEPADPLWRKRLGDFAEAWDWAATGAWISGRDAEDVNVLRGEVTAVEERIRAQVERLAATRAWSHAVSAERLTGAARANLTHYAQLVQRLGKGTGKYAVQRRGEIRQAMDRCREAVPVWIMPVYRIAEQLRIRPGMFDVVIVDEASQAGLEATFLQYLAPKIVVIGDDRQVSPSAVGVNQQRLRDLAGQYLSDDPYRASWQDPRRSLFDEAKMRFRGMLTLTEHRRCVPEIIGFSNRVAYEPDGIRLLPVRQYGVERLDPVRPVHCPDGYTRGQTGGKVNPVEVEAVVAQIEKCVTDPRYDGLSFGVISLLGTAQAKAIERELLDRIPPEEWAARDLRCGDSADFQGAERDVMFLSMVAAPSDRLGVLTGDVYVQRYNVAASRARDQMWLFHSVPLSDLGNPEDMRFQLLDHCYAVARGTGALAASEQVGDTVRVAPFESLFEQRVHNRLCGLGYTVLPRFPVEGYEIDLVVVGAKARLAVECDGDTWHGPQAYEHDLARQRDLERCGWRFHRVRESAFAVDPDAALTELVGRLRELDIHPAAPESPTVSA